MSIGRHRTPAQLVSRPAHQPAAGIAEAPISARGIASVEWAAVRVNPLLLQPRLIPQSLAQPITNTGLQLYHRTFMAAAPLAWTGRWAIVGHIVNAVGQRGRMTGIATGQVYGAPASGYAQPGYAPRVNQLRSAPPV